MKYHNFIELKNVSLKPLNYYNTMFDKNFKMLQHKHAYFEIMYCNNGKCEIHLKNEKLETKSISLQTHDFIFIDSGIYHELTFTEPCNMMNIEFIVDNTQNSLYNPSMLFSVQNFIKQSIKFSNMSKDAFRILVDHDEGVIGMIFNKLLDMLSNNPSDFDKEFLIQPIFYSLLGELGKSNAPPQNLNKSGIIHIRKAIDYIRQNFHTSISAEDVANHVGVNRIYLQRLFRENLNQSILKTINNFRINRACNLLKTSTSNINEIWKYSGFNNRQQFNYEFMVYVGTTPSKYRKMQIHNPIYHFINDYIQDFSIEQQ